MLINRIDEVVLFIDNKKPSKEQFYKIYEDLLATGQNRSCDHYACAAQLTMALEAVFAQFQSSGIIAEGDERHQRSLEIMNELYSAFKEDPNLDVALFRSKIAELRDLGL